MLTCKEATRLCSEGMDRPLELRERLTLKMHLLMCAGCSNYNAQMARLRAMTRRYAAGAFGEAPALPDGEVPPDERGGGGAHG